MSTQRRTLLRHLRVAIVLLTLVASVDVCGQTPTPTPEPKPNSQPAAAKSSANVSNPANAQTTNPSERITNGGEGKSVSSAVQTKEDVGIISDTAGIDFGPYVKELKARVKNHWEPLIPSTALPPMMKSGEVTIEFAIMKDGYIREMHLVKSSGDVALDRAALGAIASSPPFSSFPAAFPGDYLRLRCRFVYNPGFFYNPGAGDKSKAESPQKPDAKK
jgi:TonB family protein